MQRTATAHWEGNFKEGKGNLTSQSTILNKTPYSFKTRFENGAGTNPEELIAAAHAGCFTMSVDLILTQKGLNPEMLETRAIVDLDMAALKITGIHLELKGKVSGLTDEEFQTIAKNAKETCIVSKILNVPITMNASLEA
jgi:osmotically inducible protein OsmC